MAFFGIFKRSAKELGDIRCLVVTALLIALDLALKALMPLKITEDLKISFAFIAVAAIGMLYGPTVCALACVVTDVVGFFINNSTGGAFNPLFTLIEVTGGVLYGLFLYGFNPVKFDTESPRAFFKSAAGNLVAVLRITLAKVSVAIVCNLIMTPMALTLTSQAAAGTITPELFWAGYIERVFPVRIIKNAIEVPIHILILMLTLFPVMVAYRSIFKKERITNN